MMQLLGEIIETSNEYLEKKKVFVESVQQYFKSCLVLIQI